MKQIQHKLEKHVHVYKICFLSPKTGKDDSSGARHVTHITTQYASFNGQMIITKGK